MNVPIGDQVFLEIPSVHIIITLSRPDEAKPIEDALETIKAFFPFNLARKENRLSITHE